MLKGFRTSTVLRMSYFPHYHNTEYYLHTNIPAVNAGMLMIIKTFRVTDLTHIKPMFHFYPQKTSENHSF